MNRIWQYSSSSCSLSEPGPSPALDTAISMSGPLSRNRNTQGPTCGMAQWNNNVNTVLFSTTAEARWCRIMVPIASVSITPRLKKMQRMG